MLNSFRTSEVSNLIDPKSALVASGIALGSLLSFGASSIISIRDNLAAETEKVLNQPTNAAELHLEINYSESNNETELERLYRNCGPGPIEYHTTLGTDEICFTGSCLVKCEDAVASGMTRLDSNFQ